MNAGLARTAGLAAYAAGYAGALLRGYSRRIVRILRLDWRTRQFGPIRVRTPPEWGEFEPGQRGELVLHNRPRPLRVDGDAVWYASAIELRVRPLSRDAGRDTGVMRTVQRILGPVQSPLVAELRIARGVGPSREEAALTVLRSLRLIGDASLIEWPQQNVGSGDAEAPRRIVPPHDAPVARDFENFNNHQGDKA